ncbi:MAG: SH3 domain-containing protein [Candidatus Zapsychrus exili]|nr:SH3 domain-containing protein [Candidatus Zapsychrus exili]
MILRRIILSIIILFLCSGAYGADASLSASGQNIFPFVAEPTKDSVNVRAGQSVNFEKLCKVSIGEEVFVVGSQYSWYKIKLPNRAISFVSKKYIN